MAFLMEKILNDARKLSNRLKEHDGSTDNLVTQMQNLNKKIETMKTFQENLPDLNELALRKPQSNIKLGLSQENSQIRELEHENEELKQSLEEHELALELIMSKYRQQVTKLLVSNNVNQAMLYKETIQSQEIQDKGERIYEMGSMMWKAISEDDQSLYKTQEILSQLTVENKTIKDLLQICCNSGNPLRIGNRQTQTDNSCFPVNSSTIGRGVSAAGTSASGMMLNVEDNCQVVSSNNRVEIGQGTMTEADPTLSSGFKLSQASSTDGPQTATADLKRSSLPPDAVQSHLVVKEIVGGEQHLGDNLLPTSNLKQNEINGPSESYPLKVETMAISASVGPDAEQSLRDKTIEFENHSNQCQNLEIDHDSNRCVNTHIVASNSVASNSNCTVDTGASISASNSATTSTTASESALTQSSSKCSGSNVTSKNQTTLQKSQGSLLGVSGKIASVSAGGAGVQKSQSPSGRAVSPRRPALPSSGNTTSRQKSSPSASVAISSKTPPKNPAVHDSPNSSSAIKITSPGSPSFHSTKTASGPHSKATPIKIKTTKQLASFLGSGASSVVSSQFTPAISLPTTTSVSLDSNGNSNASTGVVDEISNLDNLLHGTSVDNH